MSFEQRADRPGRQRGDGDRAVCAVMVTYQGGHLILRTVAAALEQVDHLVIVDNHSDAETLSSIEQLKHGNADKISVILNARNIGLAAALNQGVAYARENRFRFVLTLDQDSLPDPDMVGRLMAVYSKRPDSKIGAVGPAMRLTYDADKELNDGGQAGGGEIEEAVVWTSGCLHPVSVFDEVGLFREDYFIDCVDCEFCFRLKKAGFRVLKAADARMVHRKGEMTTAPFLWRRCFVSNYSAPRRYYMARNGIIYWSETRSPGYLKWYIRTHLNEIPKIVFYEREKLKKLRFMFRGVVDGLKKKTGALVAG